MKPFNIIKLPTYYAHDNGYNDGNGRTYNLEHGSGDVHEDNYGNGYGDGYNHGHSYGDGNGDGDGDRYCKGNGYSRYPKSLLGTLAP